MAGGSRIVAKGSEEIVAGRSNIVAGRSKHRAREIQPLSREAVYHDRLFPNREPLGRTRRLHDRFQLPTQPPRPWEVKQAGHRTS